MGERLLKRAFIGYRNGLRALYRLEATTSAWSMVYRMTLSTRGSSSWAGVPFVIWGALIGPFSQDRTVEERMARFLRDVSLITVREGVTVDYLSSIGISRNVVRVYDPAFSLDPEPYPGPEADFVANGDVVGFNISALIALVSRIESSSDVGRSIPLPSLHDFAASEFCLFPTLQQEGATSPSTTKRCFANSFFDSRRLAKMCVCCQAMCQPGRSNGSFQNAVILLAHANSRYDRGLFNRSPDNFDWLQFEGARHLSRSLWPRGVFVANG